MTAPILYPYRRRYLAAPSRFKAAMWARQTGKIFTTTEAVLDVNEGHLEKPRSSCDWKNCIP